MTILEIYITRGLPVIFIIGETVRIFNLLSFLNVEKKKS